VNGLTEGQEAGSNASDITCFFEAIVSKQCLCIQLNKDKCLLEVCPGPVFAMGGCFATPEFK
jgi:hypothetical protein